MGYRLEDFADDIEQAQELSYDARLSEWEQSFLLSLQELEPRAFLSHSQVQKILEIKLKVEQVMG